MKLLLNINIITEYLNVSNRYDKYFYHKKQINFFKYRVIKIR